jgi:cytoskeleton protein RodZ
MKDVFQADFGARLKAARESMQLSPADIAAKLKLTARQIEALEREDFEQLPSEIFVRGFVRNYGRLVGIEPESLIAPVDVQAEVSETITAPNAGLNVGSNNIRVWLVYPMIGGALFLILVAALYHWLRQGEDTLLAPQQEATRNLEMPLPAGEIAAPIPAAPVDPAAPVVVAPDPVPSNIPADAPPVEAAPAPIPAPSAPTVVAPPTPATPTTPGVPEVARLNADNNVKSGLRSMRFEPAQDAWIQVVDGKGARFSKLVRAGSAESFSGEPPFRLVVGEAALVKLTYNGHSIDLTPYIGQKVARLTLE